MTWIPTNNARRIPVRWSTSPLRRIPLKNWPAPSSVVEESMPGAQGPRFAAIQGSCRELIITGELVM